MSLSRKRRKELKRLRSSAEELWGASRTCSSTPTPSHARPAVNSAT